MSNIEQDSGLSDTTGIVESKKSEASKTQLELFSKDFPEFVNELNQLNLDEVTPMQALVKMKKWQLGLKQGD